MNHPKCRPPRGANGVAEPINAKTYAAGRNPLRLGKRWGKDNGQPAVAFIGSINGENFIWVASCKCRDAKCPRLKALEYAREELGIEAVRVDERPRVRDGSVKVR